MLKPSWGVVSVETIQDSVSRHLSFINVVDGFIFAQQPAESNNNSLNLVPLRFHMNMCWTWTGEGSHGSPDAATVVFMSPDGTELKTETPVGFFKKHENKTKINACIQVGRFPYVGWGEYRVSVTPLGYENSGDSSVFLTVGIWDNQDAN